MDMKPIQSEITIDFEINEPELQKISVGDIIIDDDNDMFLVVGGNNSYQDASFALIRITSTLEIFMSTEDTLESLVERFTEEYDIMEVIPRNKIAIKIS